MRKPAIVPAATVSYYGPGEHATTAVHGDLLLVRHAGFLPSVIRFGERLRCWGDDRPYALVNHAATVVSDGPTAVLQEQAGKGGVLTPLRGYVHECYALVHPTASAGKAQALATQAARWYLDVGYGWASIGGDAFYLLTGIRVGLAFGQTAVCSADAAAAQRCHGLVPDKPDVSVLPSDLARYYDVRLPVAA